MEKTTFLPANWALSLIFVTFRRTDFRRLFLDEWDFLPLRFGRDDDEKKDPDRYNRIESFGKKAAGFRSMIYLLSMLWFWIRRGKPTDQFVQNLVNHTLSQINGAALTVTRNFQDGIFWKSVKIFTWNAEDIQVWSVTVSTWSSSRC